MEQEYKQAAVIGAGASGCVCAYFLLKAGFDVTLFDYREPLATLLPTGGGRCNLAHAEFDFKELVKNYPRGEKFLYSVFSRFSTADTLALFEELGVDTYIQDDGRIFPVSNSAKDVREKVLNKLKGKVTFVREKVERVEFENGNWNVKSRNVSKFSCIVVAIGGKGKIKGLDKHNFIEAKPSLVGLNTVKKMPSGIIVKNVVSKDFNLSGDILFTHFGISGPLVYKISSLKARDKFPYKLSFDLCPVEFELQEIFNSNPHREVKNILSAYLPPNLIKALLPDFAEIEACRINGKNRDLISGKIHNFEPEITGTNRGEETVSAGGVDLDEINPKTMESRIYPNLYFIGECLNIDGFCGGFNLQNAWSTAFAAAEGIVHNN